MKSSIIFSILFFAAGFFVHAHFFPEIDLYQLKILPRSPQTTTTGSTPTQTSSNTNDTFLTQITFDGNRFSRHTLTVTTASYVVITNTSKDTLMWLNSNNPLLATNRGFAESEAINVRLDKSGTYTVYDKNNPDEVLSITVK